MTEMKGRKSGMEMEKVIAAKAKGTRDKDKTFRPYCMVDSLLARRIGTHVQLGRHIGRKVG